jgi:hypothetical protein
MMARLLLDRHRLCGGAGDWYERGDERKRSQAAAKHDLLRLMIYGLERRGDEVDGRPDQ